jgi:hypothetical protein
MPPGSVARDTAHCASTAIWFDNSGMVGSIGVDSLASLNSSTVG